MACCYSPTTTFSITGGGARSLARSGARPSCSRPVSANAVVTSHGIRHVAGAYSRPLLSST